MGEGIGLLIACGKVEIRRRRVEREGRRRVTDPPDGVSIENLEKPRIELAQLPCQLGKTNGGRSWWAKSGWWVQEIGQRLQKAVVRRLIIEHPQSR